MQIQGLEFGLTPKYIPALEEGKEGIPTTSSRS